MKVKLSELNSITLQAIKSYGYDDKESETIRRILRYAQLRGNNQGVVKLIGSGIPKSDNISEPSVVKETPVSLLLKGNNTHAMIVMDHLAETAIEKAKNVGIGIAGNNNTIESTGALGYYVEKIAKEGLIGIAFASAPFQTTAPHGSNEARFCTNPIAYGIPTDEDPIILDMATSAMAYYGLIEAKTAGRSIPEGTGYDKDGNETTDPVAIMEGALKTFGGHKGSGLALIGQVIAGAFVGADSFDNDSDNCGNLVIAIDPEIFLEKGELESRVSEIISKVKSARRIDGVEEILIPGERGNLFRNNVESTGEIEIEENLWNELKSVAESGGS